MACTILLALFMVLKANWFPIISNAIFFTVYPDFIIMIVVKEVNFLYFY